MQGSFEAYCFMGHMGVTLGRLDLFKEPNTYKTKDLEEISDIINEYAKHKPIDGL